MSQVSDYNAYTSATQRRQDAYDAEKAEARESHEQEVKRLKEQSAEEVARVKEDYGKQIESDRVQARDEVRKLKEDLYDQKGKNSSQEWKDRDVERKQATQYAETVKKETDKKVRLVEKNANDRTIQQKDSENSKIEEALAAQRRSQQQEMAPMEAELTQYRNENRDLESEKAKIKQKFYDENVNANEKDKQRIIDGYERQIAQMKEQLASMENHYNERLVDNLSQAHSTSNNQLKRQKEEFTQVAIQDTKERQRLEDNFKGQVKNMRETNSRAQNNFVAKATDDQAKMAVAMDRSYQNYINDKSREQKYESDRKDAVIHELQTTDNPLKVSPMVEKRIGDMYESRFNKELKAADEAYTKNLQGTQKRELDDRRDLSNSYQDRFTGLQRSSRREMDVQKKQFYDSYENLDNTRHQQVSTLSEQRRADVERMHQKQMFDISNLEKGKQEALTEQRDVLLREKNMAIDESQQQRRDQDREWFMKANEIRRNFENKLADERDQHEKVLTQVRLEYDKKLRDQDRTSKRALEDRVRMYEFQLKQADLAFKEKERFLTEHYETELDTMRRTNAHLIEKKS